MIEYLLNLIFIPITLIFNYIFKKKNFLVNFSGHNHQVYTNEKNIPISGGLILIIFFYLKFFNNQNNLLFFLNIFFILGLFGDLNLIKSVLIRFLLQILVVFIFIFSFNLNISDIRIDIFNVFLQNQYFNYFFVTFCLLVFINGSNFIDGNNTLSLGYFITILVSLFLLQNKNIDLVVSSNFIISLLITLLILFFFNLYNKLYLGDNGIYILSSFFGFIILNLFSENPHVSPYFIAVLFWYPSFEILFSFIRKINFKISPMDADTDHLHQLLYFFLKNKLSNKSFANSLTGILINIFNILIITLSIQDIYNTKLQLILLFINILIYISFYFILKKYKKKNITY